MTTLADWIQSNFDSLVDHVIEQRRANGDARPQAVMQEATRALLRAVIAGLGDNIDWIALGAMTAEELLGQGVTDVELAASAPAMVFEVVRTDLEKAAVAERNDWLVVLARELLQASRGLATAITAHARAEQKRLEAEVIDAQRAAIRELSTPSSRCSMASSCCPWSAASIPVVPKTSCARCWPASASIALGFSSWISPG